MVPRERILTALSLKTPDAIPKEMWFNEDSYALFREKTGTVYPADYFDFEIRRVHLPPQYMRNDASFKYVRNKGPLLKVYQCGFPDAIQCGSYRELKNVVGDFHKKNLAVVGHISSVCSEVASGLIGFERFLELILLDPVEIDKLLESILAVKINMACKYARADVDIIHMGDDVGAQEGLFINPSLWRKSLKPKIRKLIDKVRQIKSNIHVLYHSDGNISEIIPDLIEVGVNAINPVQPEVMDLKWLKKEFGDDVAFWGGIGIQHLMPYGTPDEIVETVKATIDLLGKNGGLIIAPAHMVQKDTPWRNILAFFEGVNKYRISV